MIYICIRFIEDKDYSDFVGIKDRFVGEFDIRSGGSVFVGFWVDRCGGSLGLGSSRFGGSMFVVMVMMVEFVFDGVNDSYVDY